MSDRRKVCRECKTEKSIRNFYRRKVSADGYMNTCRACHCAATTLNQQIKREVYQPMRARNDAKPEAVERRRRYAQSERGRTVHRESDRIYRTFARLAA